MAASTAAYAASSATAVSYQTMAAITSPTVSRYNRLKVPVRGVKQTSTINQEKPISLNGGEFVVSQMQQSLGNFWQTSYHQWTPQSNQVLDEQSMLSLIYQNSLKSNTAKKDSAIGAAEAAAKISVQKDKVVNYLKISSSTKGEFNQQKWNLPVPIKREVPNLLDYNVAEESNNTSLNQWDASKFLEPGNFIGITADVFDATSEIGIELAPKAIRNSIRPNNIGIGTWAKYIDSESALVVSKFGTAAKIAKGAGYLAIGIDVGFGIYDNIQSGAPTEKIVSDAAVDTAFGAGGLAVSIGTTALARSIVPGIGTAAGAVVGLVAGLMYTAVTEIWKPEGQSLKDKAKASIYDSIDK